MTEPSDEDTKATTLKREKENTREEISSIQQYLHIHGHMLTREHLVTYLRRTATRIQADLITEKEVRKK